MGIIGFHTISCHAQLSIAEAEYFHMRHRRETLSDQSFREHHSMNRHELLAMLMALASPFLILQDLWTYVGRGRILYASPRILHCYGLQPTLCAAAKFDL